MAFHMEVFRSSLSSGATNVLQQVSFVNSGVLAPSGAAGMQVSAKLPMLHSFFAVGANLERVQLQAASFLPLPYPDFDGNNVGTAINSPATFWDFSRNPKVMRQTETLNVFASQISAGAETETVFVQFTDNQTVIAPPISQIPTLTGIGMYTVAHATATTTLTANAFTQVTPLLDLPLPAGQYALVGMRVKAAHALAFRIADQRSLVAPRRHRRSGQHFAGLSRPALHQPADRLRFPLGRMAHILPKHGPQRADFQHGCRHSGRYVV